MSIGKLAVKSNFLGISHPAAGFENTNTMHPPVGVLYFKEVRYACRRMVVDGNIHFDTILKVTDPKSLRNSPPFSEHI